MERKEELMNLLHLEKQLRKCHHLYVSRNQFALSETENTQLLQYFSNSQNVGIKNFRFEKTGPDMETPSYY